jgi:hypothetical protein
MATTGVSPYLPPKYTQQTEFPKAYGRDLLTQVRLIEERWNRYFTEIDYYARLQNVGIADATPDVRNPEIAAPTSPVDAAAGGFDRLWGESVDRVMSDADQWDQPHLSGTLDATTEAEGYQAPVKFRAQIKREVDKKRALELYGFDDVRDLLVIIPVSFYDACGFRAKEGDKFIWDGTEYDVIQNAGSGWWKNSNVRLFRVLNCESKRLGS